MLRVQLLPSIRASREGTPCPGCSTSVQLPAAVPGKAVEGSPSAWAPAPTWESWVKLQATCCHLQPFGE